MGSGSELQEFEGAANALDVQEFLTISLYKLLCFLGVFSIAGSVYFVSPGYRVEAA